MSRPLLTATLLVALALAGCADDGGSQDEPMLTEADCEADGLALGTDNVTGEPACVEPVPPATVSIRGLPAELQAYSTASFEWVLETDAEENHAMRTEVRVATQSTPADERTQADDWGTSVSLREHQDFQSGKTYQASWSSAEPGTYHFRAFALVQQTNLWSEEYVVEVLPVAATGVTHTVTVSAAGVPGAGSIDPAELGISIGDAVSWSTEDPDTYTITSDSGPEAFNTSTDGEAIVFLVPGTYTYSVTGSLGDAVGSGSGTIRVTA